MSLLTVFGFCGGLLVGGGTAVAWNGWRWHDRPWLLGGLAAATMGAWVLTIYAVAA